LSVEETIIFNRRVDLSDEDRAEMASATEQYNAEREVVMIDEQERSMAWVEEMDQAIQAILEGGEDVILPTPLDLTDEMQNDVQLENLELTVDWSHPGFPTYMPVIPPPPRLTPFPMVSIDPRFSKYNVTRTTYTPEFDQCSWWQGVGGGSYNVPSESWMLDGRLGSVGPIKSTSHQCTLLGTSVDSYLFTVDKLAEIDIHFNFRTNLRITVVGSDDNSLFDIKSILTCTIWEVGASGTGITTKRVFIDTVLKGRKVWNFREEESSVMMRLNLKVPNYVKPNGQYVLISEMYQKLCIFRTGSGSHWTPAKLNSIQVFQFSEP